MAGAADLRCHMWTARPVDGIESWSPDAEPDRHADGRGHALLELYARLRDRGHDVSIGPVVPAGAECVVVFAKDLDLRSSLAAARRSASLPVVVIESDWPRWRSLPLRPSVLVRSGGPGPSIGGGEVVSLPLLPQRGLVRRIRTGVVRSIGFMGSADQAPEFWTSPEFRADVAAVGLTVLDPRGAGRWHDFSDVDVALCMRRADLPTGHKPPTKLVNAWAAGSIPLVGDEPASRALGVDAEDCLYVDDASEVVVALRRLVDDPALLSVVEAGVAARGISTDSVLDRWEEVLRAAPDSQEAPSTTSRLIDWFVAQSRNVVVNRHPPTGHDALVRSAR